MTVDYPTDMILVWDEEATNTAQELVNELGDEAPPLEEAVQVSLFTIITACCECCWTACLYTAS